MFTVLILLVLVVFSTDAQHNIEQTCSPFYNQGNFKLTGHVLKTMKAATDNDCIGECKLNTKCHSINYHHGNGVCELNEANHLSKPESLVPAMGYQYVNYHQRKPARCSKKFCSSKLDICSIGDNGKDYRCVSCKDAGRQEILTFPRQAIEDKVLLENFFQSALTSFTVSIWVQGSQASTQQVFGFAVLTSPDEIAVFLEQTKLKFFFKDWKNVIEVNFSHLSKWHHYLVTWENAGGKYNAYVDGVFKGTKTVEIGSTVSNGALILGQDQDSYKGGLDATQAFQGNMTNMNMWDRVLNSQEITALSQSCTSGDEGNILKWSDLKHKGEGQVTLVCSDACV